MTLFGQRVNIVPVWASFGFRGLFQVNCGDLIDPARLDLGVPAPAKMTMFPRSLKDIFPDLR